MRKDPKTVDEPSRMQVRGWPRVLGDENRVGGAHNLGQPRRRYRGKSPVVRREPGRSTTVHTVGDRHSKTGLYLPTFGVHTGAYRIQARSIWHTPTEGIGR